MIYSEERFKNLADHMVEMYGVSSYKDNYPEDLTLWFMCPECEEPILYEDWAKELNSLIDGDEFCCPICEIPIEF